MRTLPRNLHTHEHGTGRAPSFWLMAPAKSMLPFIRSPLGYEIVNPAPVAVMLLIEAAVAFVLAAFWPPAAAGARYFDAFLVLSFIVSSMIFYRRVQGLRRGEEVHSAEAGYSFLTYHTALPVLLSELVIVPAAFAGIGYVIARTVSYELGWWLVLCAASYLLVSWWEAARRRAQTQSILDDMTRAQSFSERLAEHERKSRTTGRQNDESGRAGNYGGTYAEEPDVAGLGVHPGRRAAEPPDMAGWRQGSDSVAPDFMSWFRKGRGR